MVLHAEMYLCMFALLINRWYYVLLLALVIGDRGMTVVWHRTIVRPTVSAMESPRRAIHLCASLLA